MFFGTTASISQAGIVVGMSQVRADHIIRLA